MNIFISFSCLVILCILNIHTGGEACYIQLEEEGIAIYPMMKVLRDTKTKPARWWGESGEGNCMLYKRTWRRHALILKIQDLRTNGHNVTVYAIKWHGQWEPFATLGNEDKNSDLILADYRAIKIIVHDDTVLGFQHQNAFCMVPDSVVTDLCTDGLHRTSTCGFSCNSPLYVTSEPFPSFTAQCRSDHSWTPNFSSKCTSLEKVMDDCFTIELESETDKTKSDDCIYTDEQLASFFPEIDSIAGPSYLPFSFLKDIARIKYGGLYVGIDGDKGRSGGGPCFDYCLRNDGGKYHLKCDKQKGSAKKKLCWACRYKYKVCQRYAGLIV